MMIGQISWFCDLHIAHPATGYIQQGGHRNVHETPSKGFEYQGNTEEACCEVTSFTCKRETRTHFHGMEVAYFIIMFKLQVVQI